MFPKLRSALSAEQLHDIGQKLADGKAKAPTRTRPRRPAARAPRWPARPPAWSTGSATSSPTAPPTRVPSTPDSGGEPAGRA